ncbi:hypothetical protein K5549_021619, partial [Capra hircus]
TGGAEGQGGVDEPGDPDGLEGHQGLGGMGEAGAAMARAPEPAHVRRTPGPGGDALPGLVLFPSLMEAEMAHQSLRPHVQPYHRAVGKELTVNSSIIAIRWTAEDLAFIRLSLNPFLDQLSLVIRNIRALG